MDAGVVAVALLALLITPFTLAEGEGRSASTNETKYALSYCLSKAYPGSEFSSDAGHVAGAYLELGVLGIDAYETIRQRVDIHVAEEYASKHDRNLSIMRCLDLLDADWARVR